MFRHGMEVVHHLLNCHNLLLFCFTFIGNEKEYVLMFQGLL
jgi:hypothetical protein